MNKSVFVDYENEFFSKESQVNQILILLNFHENISQSEVKSLLSKSCYLVTNVTDVTLENIQEKKGAAQNFLGNKRNKGTRVTTLSSLRASIKTAFNRLVKQELVLVDKSSKEFLYKLSVTGQGIVTEIVKKWEDQREKKQDE